jgi:hypothetical protein
LRKLSFPLLNYEQALGMHRDRVSAVLQSLAVILHGGTFFHSALPRRACFFDAARQRPLEEDAWQVRARAGRPMVFGRRAVPYTSCQVREARMRRPEDEERTAMHLAIGLDLIDRIPLLAPLNGGWQERGNPRELSDDAPNSRWELKAGFAYSPNVPSERRYGSQSRKKSQASPSTRSFGFTHLKCELSPVGNHLGVYHAGSVDEGITRSRRILREL